MTYPTINFQDKFAQFSEQWSPKIIAQLNDTQFKIAKIQGEFVWHRHPDTDEAFIVIRGAMQIEFRDSVTRLKIGEMVVVPKGVEHKPVAENECQILMIELAGTVNTGEADSDLKVETLDWI
jgi:mannose-6-phosphate isomerase-like protein (cupin superfamily)